MPVLDNLTTLIRKARALHDAPHPNGPVLNIEALKATPKLTLPVKPSSEEEDLHHALFESGLYLARRSAGSAPGRRASQDPRVDPKAPSSGNLKSA